MFNFVFKKVKSFPVLVVVSLLVVLPFVLNISKANSLGEGYLFLGTMQTEVATDMILMFTPSSNFDSTEESREFRIIFPEAEGAWCLQDEGSLSVTAVTGSPVDQGDWSIDEGLPGSLSATCYQGGVGASDYIEITGIDHLTSGVSYGLEIDSNAAVFQTGSTTGGNLISLQLIEGTNTQSIAFEINLLDDDKVVIDAYVDEASTITCTVGENVNLGTLFLGGAYVTGNHSLSTLSSGSGFYWAVYGENAGLSHTTEESVLSSEGVDGIVDLISGEGFGMVLSSSTLGVVQPNYLPTTSGVFGAIGTDAKLILQSDNEGEGHYTATLGARASINATPGAYQETLTYVCGAYIIGLPEFACYIEQGNYTQDISFEEDLFNFMVNCSTGYDWETVSASVLKDNVTGLYWSESSASPITYTDAINHCDNLTLEGRTDWRLPTKDELMQIAPADIDFDYGDPWVCDGCYSGNDMYAYDSAFATENYFWAVNQVEGWDPAEFWALLLEDGDLMPASPGNDTSNHVRCVSRD